MTDNCLANGERSSWLSLYLSNHDCGNVTSIFTHSLNIQFPGILFHVGRQSETLSCLGITLPDDQVMSVLRQVKLNDVARFINGAVYIYTQKAVVPLPVEVLDLVDLNVPTNLDWQCLSQPIGACFAEIPFQTKWGLDGIANVEQVKNQLVEATSETAIRNVANHLVGRGRGLTPSGDDVMVGFTTALTAFQDVRTSLWQSVLKELAGQKLTTSVSTGYLYAAADGVASQKLIRLVQAVKHSQSEEIRLAIQEVENFGHTSGIDTLFGFWSGLEAVTLSNKDKN